jgi:hypothetical protein
LLSANALAHTPACTVYLGLALACLRVARRLHSQSVLVLLRCMSILAWDKSTKKARPASGQGSAYRKPSLAPQLRTVLPVAPMAAAAVVVVVVVAGWTGSHQMRKSLD